ncbi:CAP domain-containing protein [Corynebacterium genitalium]|nr:CAP domain-containing protein [Corynebacterium genitalium]
MKKRIVATAVAVALAAVPAPAQAQDLSSSFASMSSLPNQQYDPARPWDVAEPSRAKTYRNINFYRIQNGRLPWLQSGQLDAQAQAWAEELSRTNSFRHSDANVYENIAFSSHSPEAAFEQWRTSPGHNRNMLSNARAVGIGAAHGYVAGHGWGYIVVMQAR